MKIITIHCDDATYAALLRDFAAYNFKYFMVKTEGRGRPKTVSHGSRQHQAAPQMDEGKSKSMSQIRRKHYERLDRYE